MSQHPMVIDDGTGQEVLDAVTAAVQALASNNSGAGAPQETFPYMWWPDTTNDLLKLRNGSNTAWITVGTLSETNLGLQPADATLTALAALATAADKLIYATGSDAFSTATLTAFARTLLDDADAATALATLGAASSGHNHTGTYQPLDATLTALAALTTAADKLIYATGSDAFSTCTFTAQARTLLACATVAAQQAALSLSTMAGFDAACTDGNFAYQGQAASFTTLVSTSTLTAEADLNSVSGNKSFAVGASTTNSPVVGGDGGGIQIVASGQTTQIVAMGSGATNGGLYVRVDDGAGWQAWEQTAIRSLANTLGKTTVSADDTPLVTYSYSDLTTVHGLVHNAARGTSTAPTKTTSGTRLWSALARGHNGTAHHTNFSGEIKLTAAEDGDVGNGAHLDFLLAPTGSDSLRQQAMRLSAARNLLIGTTTDNATDKLQVSGSTSATGPAKIGQYTLATLPSASAYSGYLIDVTNATGGAKVCRSDGSAWKILNTTTTVS